MPSINFFRSPKAKVFISYRRQAGKTLAQHLKEYLEKNGLQTYLDVYDPDPGLVDERIFKNIYEVDVVIILLTQDCFTNDENVIKKEIDSENDQKRDYFIDEINHAISINKPIITIITPEFKERHGFPEGIPREIRKQLSRIQGIPIPSDAEYFEGALTKVRERILNIKKNKVKHQKNYSGILVFIGIVILLFTVYEGFLLKKIDDRITNMFINSQLSVSDSNLVLIIGSGTVFNYLVQESDETLMNRPGFTTNTFGDKIAAFDVGSKTGMNVLASSYLHGRFENQISPIIAMASSDMSDFLIELGILGPFVEITLFENAPIYVHFVGKIAGGRFHGGKYVYGKDVFKFDNDSIQASTLADWCKDGRVTLWGFGLDSGTSSHLKEIFEEKNVSLSPDSSIHWDLDLIRLCNEWKEKPQVALASRVWSKEKCDSNIYKSFRLYIGDENVTQPYNLYIRVRESSYEIDSNVCLLLRRILDKFNLNKYIEAIDFKNNTLKKEMWYRTHGDIFKIKENQRNKKL